jgi:hypothetical protein
VRIWWRFRLWAFVLAAHVLLIVWINEAFAPQSRTTVPSPPVAVQVTLLEPVAQMHEKPSVVAQPSKVPQLIPEAIPQPLVQALVVAPAVAAPAPVIEQTSLSRYLTPESFRMSYVVTKGNDSAKAALTWRVSAPANAQTPYDLTYEATYFGVSMVKQTSVGLLGNGGLAPVRFGDKRRGKSEQATHFDAATQRVTFSNNRPDSALATGSQDRSSILIQLASLFAGDPAKWRAGQVIEIPVASTDELELWRFEVQGEDVLALPAGERSAVHLIRRARRAFDQTIELWLAPSLAYLPVRIRQTDSSGVTDVQLLGSEKL